MVPPLVTLMGSSPRMRGADGRVPDKLRACRIIPAHAGSRRCRCSMVTSMWDHPRACGEQCYKISRLTYQ